MTPHNVNLATLKCGSPDCRKRVPLTLVYCCDGCAEGLDHQPSTCRGVEAPGDLYASRLPARQSTLKMGYAFS